ncbi:MAG: lipoprotein [Gammaproteobacteria bacterium]|nr:lipoprotein [Gammaproteobacteria bacterium]
MPGWLLLVIVCGLVFSGCGQKGPLYIPTSITDTPESGVVQNADPEEDEKTNSKSD